MQLDLLSKESVSVTQETSVASSATESVKAASAFKTISEVADYLDIPQHVLRFWESRFPQVKPLYRAGRRYYRPQDVEALLVIKELLYQKGFTIKGAKKALGQNKRDESPKSAKEKPQRTLTDKQHSQLSVIRQELVSMREALESHL